MKKLSNPIIVCFISAALGLLCLLCRLWLMQTGFDSKQLLMPDHPGNTLSLILPVVLAVLLLAAWFIRPSGYTFQPNRISAAGAGFSVLALIQTAVVILSGLRTPLAIAAGILAALSALCNAGITGFRLSGKRAWLPLYLPSLLTLMLQFLHCFRLWGAQPELQRYLFLLGAQTFITLGTYYRAAAECRMHTPRAYVLLSGGAIFFGLAAIADGASGLPYGFWAISFLLEIVSVRLPRRKRHETA